MYVDIIVTLNARELTNVTSRTTIHLYYQGAIFTFSLK